MKSNKFKLTRLPINPNKTEVQVSYRSSLDFGTLDELRAIDSYFQNLLKSEADNIRKLGLDPDRLSLTIS